MINKIILALTLAVSFQASANLNFSKDFSFKMFKIDQFKQELSSKVFGQQGWPESLKSDGRKYALKYTTNHKLEKRIKRLLKKYRSDFASVVVIDNNTGKILSAVDYTKKGRKFGISLSFSSTNPAASVFKVITAADLVENTSISKDSLFSYNGKSSTLYKYQLKKKKNKWTRTIPFKSAFARSNNVIFGKAAIYNSSASSLRKTANKFGFNTDLLQIIDTGESQLYNVSNEYALAELASGFNRGTMISPLHGAVIASVIANDGILKKPTILDEIFDSKQDRVVWKPKYILKRVISKKAASQVKSMMINTVKKGTARGAFKPWKMKKLAGIEIGGKTGTITGGLPYGKRDWFVSYAKPIDEREGKGISVCVMIVNVKHWYIKSTYLAKKIIQYYYNDVKS